MNILFPLIAHISYGYLEERYNDYFLRIDFADPLTLDHIEGSIDASEFQTELVSFANFISGERPPQPPLETAELICRLPTTHHLAIARDFPGLAVSALALCGVSSPDPLGERSKQSAFEIFGMLPELDRETLRSAWLIDRLFQMQRPL